ncbi:hypothetical protein HK096_007274, partial [Nowakowskiella sp. JEL0078]
ISILVVDKSIDVAQGASKANSGIIHGGFDDRHGSIKSKLSYKGNQMFDQLNQELSFGLRRCGSLVLAFSEDDRKILEDLIVNGRKNGVPDLVILEKEDVLKLEPNLTSNILCALWCKAAGVTPPYLYTIALAENAAANGVEFKMEREVVDIERDENGIFSVRCSHESSDFRSKVVINCAGLYADKIAGMIGADDFRIVPRKGEYILLDKTQGSLVNTVLFPVPSKKFGKGILVSPTYDGNLLIGPTSRGREEAHMTNRQVLATLLTSAKRTVPIVNMKQAITSYAGLRAKNDRADFIIEQSKTVRNFINVAGIDSPGLTSSPAIAEMVVDILRNQVGLLLIRDDNWNPIRHPYEHVNEKNAGQDDQIICLCEGVYESEIVDAVTRAEFPASTTDMVKKRTRAGMGPCQGQRCNAKVAAIIAREWGIDERDVGRRGPGSSVLPHRQITPEDKNLLEMIAQSEENLIAKAKL